ncbi:MAG TPA: hypothetical protein DF613_06920 [Lachnospiraceae bacterium]|nr:hypothetical protein [Lachnospiraceae bacterium]
MARAKLTGFEDLERFLGKLEEPRKMAVKAVDAAAPLAEKRLKAEITKAANRKDARGKPYSTGELAASVGRTKTGENELGIYSVVLPMGTDKRGLRNVEKLAYLEYGVKSKGQAPHPVRQRTVNAVEAKCQRVMEETVYREVDKL